MTPSRDILALGFGLEKPWKIIDQWFEVVANKNAARSVGLAKYYMQKRGIPEDNLLEIWVTDNERCSREEFDAQIAVPVHRFVKENKGNEQIRCLLLMYGVPMKASGPPITEKEKAVMDRLEAEKQALSERLAGLEGHEAGEVNKELQKITKRIRNEKNTRNKNRPKLNRSGLGEI